MQDCEKVLELLRRLVEIPSPSGEEDEIIAFISDHIERSGFDVVEDVYGLTVRGENEHFWIVTHVDTVSTDYKFHFDGCYAYGTGVCDAKGGVAAVLIALEDIADRGSGALNMSIALLRDEEGDGTGSEEFARRRGERNDECDDLSGGCPSGNDERRSAIVMEPTSLRVADVHFGSLEISLRLRGRPAHGSTAERGVNAIDEMLRIINDLREIHPSLFLQRIHGGSDLYAVPEYCEARMEFRLKPPDSASSLKEALMKKISSCIVVGEGAEDGEVVCHMDILDETDGFFIEGAARSTLESAIRAVGMHVEHCEMPSWTDASNLHECGWDVAVWGPGELWRCHTRMERISLDEIARAKHVLIALNDLIARE